MINRYLTYIVNSDGPVTNLLWRTPIKVERDCEPVRDDERRLDELEAIDRAKVRAAKSGFFQQVSQIDGPLYGGKQWLIQHTDVKIPKFKVGDRVKVTYEPDSEWNGPARVIKVMFGGSSIHVVSDNKYVGGPGSFSPDQLEPYVEPATFTDTKRGHIFTVGDRVYHPAAGGKTGKLISIDKTLGRVRWDADGCEENCDLTMFLKPYVEPEPEPEWQRGDLVSFDGRGDILYGFDGRDWVRVVVSVGIEAEHYTPSSPKQTIDARIANGTLVPLIKGGKRVS